MSQQIRKVGIVGAGAMGRGIAQVCAAAGCEVALFDMATVQGELTWIQWLKVTQNDALFRGRDNVGDKKRASSAT